ncbi:MAG: hypothetical protein JO112_19050, partial [Planctomycetes bacterium]|nr:hypothetical protein [Planctomycetota bacterium]
MREDVRIQQWQRDLAQPHRHPGPADLDQFGTQALAWVVQHFTTLPEQSIGETASRAHMEGLLGEPAPETGQAFARVFAEFREKIAPFAFRVDHPRFLAFVPGAPTFWSILGDLLCAG